MATHSSILAWKIPWTEGFVLWRATVQRVTKSQTDGAEHSLPSSDTDVSYPVPPTLSECLGLDGHLSRSLSFLATCHRLWSSALLCPLGREPPISLSESSLESAVQGRPRSRRWQIPGLVGPSSGWQTSLCAHKLSVTLMRAPDPFTRAPPPCPHSVLITFPRPRLLTPWHRGEGLHGWVLRGHRRTAQNNVSINPCIVPHPLLQLCLRSSVSKEFAWNAGDLGLIPGLGRSPGEGNGNPLQYSCLENPMGRGAWRAAVQGVTKVRHDLVTKPPAPSLPSPASMGQVPLTPQPQIPYGETLTVPQHQEILWIL